MADFLPEPYPHLPQGASPEPGIDFVMVGFRKPDGTVELFSSRQVDDATWEWDYPDDDWPTFTIPREMRPARALAMSAEMQNLVVTIGDDYPDALAVLHRHWKANTDD